MSHCAVSVTRVLVKFVVVLAVVLAGAVSDALAQTGTISGTITSSTTGLALPNGEVHFYELTGSVAFERMIAPVNGLGQFSINLPPGAYGVLTQNKSGYINEVYDGADGIPCSAVCDVDALTPVVVTNGSASVANFVLDPGGRIAGRVTDSSTGQGLAGVTLYFVPQSGEVPFSFATTDSNGDYLSDGGTVAGTIFAAAFAPGYRSELFDDIKCADCDPTEGTPMVVAGTGINGGFNFALDPGGSISGTVRDANLAPLAGVEITILDSTGEEVEFAITDALGNYRSGGLLTGSYYVMTNQNPFGLIDQVWNGIPCPNGYCNPTQAGTLVAVTLGAITPGINFTLSAGGRITGTVTNAATGQPIFDNLFVQLHDAAGQFVGGANTDKDTGLYNMPGVPPGTYYAIVGYTGFFNQIYNGITCSVSCQIVLGTPIHVAVGAVTASIDFALVPQASVGSISGTLTDAGTGSPVASGLNVQLFTITGAQIANVNTNASGVYTFTNLAAASYYVRTNPGGGFPLIGTLHGSPDVVCLNCNVTTSGGTPVPVTAGATTTINFTLTRGVRISGTVTNAVGGAGIQNVTVQVFNSSGVNLGQGPTNVSGGFTTRALPDGSYFLKTSNALGFVDKLYDNLFCSGPSCSVVNGTPIVAAGAGTTVTGRNFVLATGGRISGNVVGPNPLQSLQFQMSVGVYTDTGIFLGNQGVDASNNYLTFAVPAGRYYLRTANAIGLLDEVYDNVACAGTCVVISGTPVDVVAGATTAGKNFSLVAGGNIAGTVRDAGTSALLSSVRVVAYLADGTAVKTGATNANGEYSIIGLPVGTYYLKTSIVGPAFYLDELYNEIPCPVTCTLTTGTPVVVTAGVTEGGKNFTLTPGGGAVSGTVLDTSGNQVSGIAVQLYLANGTLVKQVAANANGFFTASMPSGTYYARTFLVNATVYLDELFNEMPCTPTCNVASGAPIVVVDGATTPGINFTVGLNLVRNGRFDSGLSNWVQFATPDQSNIVAQVTNGVLEYYRVNPGANQAVVFQETGIALPANAPLSARFSIGNSSSVRKRISVLVLDSNFSDLSVCTFWIPPNTPLTAYRMITHTTQAWTNAAIYFYAASAGSNGGFYQLDNVSVERAPAESAAETTCVDPLAPAPVAVANGPEMLGNGNFNTGTPAPWGPFGQIDWQIVGGVFQFRKLAGAPSGVVLQPTGLPIDAGTILTATFQLGNSSGQRQRVTAIVHDNTFGDLSACTFWIPAGQPLSDYTYRTFTTQAWTNATLSIYPATTNGQQWLLLDNATFRTTRSASILGTECVEPGGTLAPTGLTSGFAQAAGFTLSTPREPQIVQRDAAIDLTASTSATFALRAWLPRSAAWGEVQVRGDDGEWRTVQVIRGSDDWAQLVVDLTEYLGQVVDVRVVVYPE